MADGTIIARAFTSRAMIPIENATVAFSQYTPDGEEELLAVRSTNESGITDPVVIPTPELAESLTPEPGRPYALVNVDAYHPDYARILVEFVQIFPGIQTVQNLDMIPLEEYPTSYNETEVFDLPPQNL